MGEGITNAPRQHVRHLPSVPGFRVAAHLRRFANQHGAVPSDVLKHVVVFLPWKTHWVDRFLFPLLASSSGGKATKILKTLSGLPEMGASASLSSMTDLCKESEDPSSRLTHVKQKSTHLFFLYFFLQKISQNGLKFSSSAPSFPQARTPRISFPSWKANRSAQRASSPRYSRMSCGG